MKRLLAILLVLLAYPALALGPLTAYQNLPAAQRNQLQNMALYAGSPSDNNWYALQVDTTTGSLPVSITSGTVTASFAAVGTTGAAVPASAAYMGMNVGGNLTGLAGTANGLKVDGSAVTQPVSGTFWQATQPVSGTVSANLNAGSNLIGKVGIDQTTPGTTNAVAATNLPTTVDTNAGAQGASTLRMTQAGRAITSTILANNSYSGTNVTTSAYVQLIASTASAVNMVCLANSSGSIIKMATGAAASEVDRIYVPAGGSGCFGVNIAASTRISLEALDATASTGYFLFTGLP